MKMDMKGEELRDIMHKAIDKYGDLVSKEVVKASQNLDKYMNSYCRKNN